MLLMAKLQSLVLFLLGLVVVIGISYVMQRGETKIKNPAAYIRKNLRSHWVSTLIGLLFAFNSGPGDGIFALVVARVLGRWFRGPKVFTLKDQKSDWQAQAANDQKAWTESLGNTPDERIATINQMFDRKEKTLSMTVWHENEAGLLHSYLAFRISRNLGAMDTREREMLRAVELYDIATNGQKAEWVTWAKFGLLYGNGKATLDKFAYEFPQGDQMGIKDGPSALNWYMNHRGANVDSVVSRVLETVQTANATSSSGQHLAPVMTDINARLTGGNAWLTPQELGTTIFAPNSRNAVTLGILDGTQQPLTYAGEGSMITIAPPGAGKTECSVLPTLLSWRGPAVVLDVKGEIYAKTSKWRAENVGPVYKFSPLDPARSHKYNPLSFIREDTDYIWEDSRFLADMMVVPSGGSDPFWETKARDVIAAAIAHVCYSAPPDKRPMSKVVDIIHGGKAWDDMITGLQTAVDVRAMMQQGSSLGSMNEKTRDSVLQTAQASLSAWAGERISRATQSSDWSPLDLRSGKNPTIYICFKPSEVESYISVMRVFIAQHIRMLTSEMPAHGAQPILFMLDELPRLRHMPPVEEAIEIGRSFGLRLWMFAQSLGQLENAYPNAEGMVGSCAVRIFMNPSAHDGLAERLSDQLGYRQSALDGTRMRLVEPSELAGPAYRDYQIVIAGSCKPAKVKKAFAWQNPELTSRMGTVQQ
jgi:type IV secretion system protein VirD4